MSRLITWLCWSVNINNTTSLNVWQPQPQRNSNRHHLTTNSHCHSNTQALGDMQEGGCWKVGNDQNRPKQCETCHLGPRWVFLFIFMLFYINGYFIVFIGCIYNLSEREMVRTTGRIKTGPNNVRRVVLALGEFFCFFFFFSCYFILMDILLYL